LIPESQSAFISYSRGDSEFALRLAEDLRAAGAAVWLDQLDITPGQRWAGAVEDALNNCQQMLVILSPSSSGSKNVGDEVSFALEEEKNVIPVLYRQCKIPLRLRSLQYADFRTGYARGLQDVLAAIKLGSIKEGARTDLNPRGNLPFRRLNGTRITAAVCGILVVGLLSYWLLVEKKKNNVSSPPTTVAHVTAQEQLQSNSNGQQKLTDENPQHQKGVVIPPPTQASRAAGKGSVAVRTKMNTTKAQPDTTSAVRDKSGSSIDPDQAKFPSCLNGTWNDKWWDPNVQGAPNKWSFVVVDQDTIKVRRDDGAASGTFSKSGDTFTGTVTFYDGKEFPIATTQGWSYYR
jgi:hypothetical protein